VDPGPSGQFRYAVPRPIRPVRGSSPMVRFRITRRSSSDVPDSFWIRVLEILASLVGSPFFFRTRKVSPTATSKAAFVTDFVPAGG